MTSPSTPCFPPLLDPYTRKLLAQYSLQRSAAPFPPPPLMFPPGVGIIPNIFPRAPSVSPPRSHLADIPDIKPPSPPPLSRFPQYSGTKHFHSTSPILTSPGNHEPSKFRGDLSKFSIETLMSTTTNQSRRIKKEPELEEEERFSPLSVPQHQPALQQQQQHSLPYSFHPHHFAALQSFLPKILEKQD